MCGWCRIETQRPGAQWYMDLGAMGVTSIGHGVWLGRRWVESREDWGPVVISSVPSGF